MKNLLKTNTFKIISISPPFISSNENRKVIENNIKKDGSKNEISSLKYNDLNSINNIENQEYNYELDQSNDSNLNIIREDEESPIERKNEEIIDNNFFIKFPLNNNLNIKKRDNNSIYNNIFMKELIYKNEKIKKSIILQQILINQMKNYIENLKKENENLKIDFDIQKKNIIEQYESQLNNNRKEKNKLNEVIKNQKLEINSLNKLIYNKKEEIIRTDNGNKNNPDDKYNFNKIEGENNIIWDNNIKLIDNSYEALMHISKNLLFLNENNFLNDEKSIFINLNNYKEFMSIDNNGIISIKDKLIRINSFINAANLGIEEIIDCKNNKSINNINISNNLFQSENGQNNIVNNKNNTDKKYFNNKIFKKINSIINKNLKSKNNNIYDYITKGKSFENNDKIFINKNRDFISINNNRNKISLKSNLLEKNSIIYKCNLSPINKKEIIFNASNNDNFSFKCNNLINEILNSNEKVNNNKIKNIKLNTNIILNNSNNSKDNIFFDKPIIKNIKKSKIPFPESIKINKTINYKKIKENLPRLRIISSNRNKLKEKKFRSIYKTNSGTNSFNIQNYTFDKKSFLSNSKEENFKRIIQFNNINSNNKGFERNKINQLDYIKTEIKNNSEYIKIKDIFQNKNISNIFINSHVIPSNKNENFSKTSKKTYSNENQNSLDFRRHENQIK